MAPVNDDRPERPRDQGRSVAGPVLIVVPSLLSGAGLILILIALFLDNDLAQQIVLAVGVMLLWSDFFTSMAIFRYSLRSMNRRMGRLELRVERLTRQESEDERQDR